MPISLRAHEKVFSSKKMPLCHLPGVYQGSRGGIMVALVAFSGDFGENIGIEFFVLRV